MVQRLRPHVSNAEGPVLIPLWGSGSHVLQLKIPQAATKTESNQINIKKERKKDSWKLFGKPLVKNRMRV